MSGRLRPTLKQDVLCSIDPLMEVVRLVKTGTALSVRQGLSYVISLREQGRLMLFLFLYYKASCFRVGSGSEVLRGEFLAHLDQVSHSSCMIQLICTGQVGGLSTDGLHPAHEGTTTTT